MKSLEWRELQLSSIYDRAIRYIYIHIERGLLLAWRFSFRDSLIRADLFGLIGPFSQSEQPKCHENHPALFVWSAVFIGITARFIGDCV